MRQKDYIGLTLERKYVLEKLLGQGGMGSVYQGRHIVIGKQVAVKMLHAEYVTNEDILKRFYREAQAAAAIGHKNIIDVLDVGVTPDGDPFIVMEFLQGEDLESLLKRTETVDLSCVCGILEPALLALEAAHSKGIVHRDLKPANIFLTHEEAGEPTVKLIDFGISKFSQNTGQTRLTQTGTLMGTPDFMAPEQARGETDVDHRVDLYAMGVIVYHMLTGGLPFVGANYNELLVKVLTEAPVPPAETNENFPVEAESFVLKSIAKDPNERFQSAIEMLEALKQLSAFSERHSGMTQLGTSICVSNCASGDLGSEITDSGNSASSASGVLAQMTSDAEGSWGSSRIKKSSNKNILLLSIVGVVLVVGIAMGGLLFLKNDKLNVQPIEVPIQPASQVKSAEKAPPKTEGIKITVTGMPDGSTIYYDKMPVPVNPFRVKPRNTIVPIKVEADGYEPFITSVVPSKDIGVEVKLVLLKDTENDSEKDNDDNEKLTQKRRHKKQGVIKKKKKNGAETKSASGSKNTKGFKKGGRETLFSEDFE